MNVVLRDARSQDAAAIRDVTLAAYREYADIIPDRWEGYRRNILDTLADPGPAAQIVAEADDTIVGAVLLYPPNVSLARPKDVADTVPWPEIRLLAVTPTHRGHGVGEALVRACLHRAREVGADAVALHTTDAMRAAVRLYERMGFVRAPELDFRPAPGVTAKGYLYRLDEDGQHRAWRLRT